MKHIGAQIKRNIAGGLELGETLLVCGPGNTPNDDARELAAQRGNHIVVSEAHATSFSGALQVLDGANTDINLVVVEASQMPVRDFHALLRYLKDIRRRAIVGCSMPRVEGDVIRGVHDQFRTVMPVLDHVLYVDAGMLVTIKPQASGMRQEIAASGDGVTIRQTMGVVPEGTEIIGFQGGTI